MGGANTVTFPRILRIIAVPLLGMALLLAGCTSKTPATRKSGKLRVAVSILPQVYLVQKIGGPYVDVHALVPPGASHETYEPTIPQIEEMRQAQVYVKVGAPTLPFEKVWFGKLEGANPTMKVVDSSQGIDFIDGDPHIWLSVRNAEIMAGNIADGLSAADPTHKKEYAANRDALVANLKTLDTTITGIFKGKTNRSFIVFHPAWNYFARDYNLTEVAIEQEGKEPDPATLEKLVNKAKADGIKCIYVEPQFSKKSAEIIAGQLGGKTVVIDPLPSDFAGNMKKVAEDVAAGMK